MKRKNIWESKVLALRISVKIWIFTLQCIIFYNAIFKTTIGGNILYDCSLGSDFRSEPMGQARSFQCLHGTFYLCICFGILPPRLIPIDSHHLSMSVMQQMTAVCCFYMCKDFSICTYLHICYIITIIMNKYPLMSFVKIPNT